MADQVSHLELGHTTRGVLKAPRYVQPSNLPRRWIFSRNRQSDGGFLAVYELDDRPVVFASYLVRVECDDRVVDSRYVCGWINSPRKWAW